VLGRVVRCRRLEPRARYSRNMAQLQQAVPVTADDPRLPFVLIEIELGITFVRSAVLAYQSGHDEHGDSAKASAIKAIESAKHFIGHLDPFGQLVAGYFYRQ
jgi:hypothetical protein